jgi:hypothetical protein
MKKSIAAVSLFLLAGTANAQLVVGNDQTAPVLWLVDLTGANPPRVLANAAAWGAAADDAGGILYWNDGTNLSRAMYTPAGPLSPTTIGMTLAGSGGSAASMTGLAYDSTDNKLYGFKSTSTIVGGVTYPIGIYEINPLTGEATLAVATPSQDYGGLDYDPVTDCFYGLNDTANGPGRGLIRITKPLSTATFTNLTPYPGSDTDIDGLAIGGGLAYFVNDVPSQGIPVYNLGTGAFEATLPSPFTGTNGIFSAGAWAPGLGDVPSFEVGIGLSAPANCTVSAGGQGDFVATVTNIGQQPVTNTTVEFTIPDSAVFVSSVPAATPVGNTLTVNLGSLAPSSQASLTVTLALPNGGTYQASANVTINEPDGSSANNTSSASTFVPLAPPTTAAVKGVLSSIPGQANSQVPDRPWMFFTSTGFDQPFRSPDGTWFVLTADTDAPTTMDQVLLVGHNGTITVGVTEGDFLPDGDTVGVIDTTYGINDAGHFVFSFNSTTGLTTNDEVIVKFDGTTFVTVVREGDMNPALGLNYGTTNGSAQIQADGSVSFHTNLVGATTATDTAIFKDSGVTLVAQEGITIPTNQIDGATFTVKAVDTGATDGQGFFTNADGSRYIWSGTVNDVTTQDRVVVVDGAVVIQENAVIPGSGFASPVGATIHYAFMESNGDWFSYGVNLDGTDWAVRNGTVIAATHTPIYPGATELWDDAPYAQTFFLAIGNNRGDYVVGGTTNGPNISNAVLVLNGTTVLMRENDPVDLDNNGVFDDGVYVRTFRDDYAFMNDEELYIVVRLRNESDATGCSSTDIDIGQALVRIALPSTGPTCGTADFDGDGDVGTDADIEAFFACLAGNCCDTCWHLGADFDGDGDSGTDADIEAFFRVLAGGNC